jgi:hypothetical protein
MGIFPDGTAAEMVKFGVEHRDGECERQWRRALRVRRIDHTLLFSLTFAFSLIIGVYGTRSLIQNWSPEVMRAMQIAPTRLWSR